MHPLIDICKDPNPVTRTKIVELLGEIGGPDARKACEKALMDGDPGVRWRERYLPANGAVLRPIAFP